MGHDDAVSQMCWFEERLYTASWDSTVKVGTAERGSKQRLGLLVVTPFCLTGLALSFH